MIFTTVLFFFFMATTLANLDGDEESPSLIRVEKDLSALTKNNYACVLADVSKNGKKTTICGEVTSPISVSLLAEKAVEISREANERLSEQRTYLESCLGHKKQQNQPVALLVPQPVSYVKPEIHFQPIVYQKPQVHLQPIVYQKPQVHLQPVVYQNQQVHPLHSLCDHNTEYGGGFSGGFGGNFYRTTDEYQPMYRNYESNHVVNDVPVMVATPYEETAARQGVDLTRTLQMRPTPIFTPQLRTVDEQYGNGVMPVYTMDDPESGYPPQTINSVQLSPGDAERSSVAFDPNNQQLEYGYGIRTVPSYYRTAEVQNVGSPILETLVGKSEVNENPAHEQYGQTASDVVKQPSNVSSKPEPIKEKSREFRKQNVNLRN